VKALNTFSQILAIRIHSAEFIPSYLIKEEQALDYDKEKYRDMFLEPADIVLGFFGFDRTVYGDTSKRKSRKWWAALSEERLRDRYNERI
jgi:hypothetical protein